MKKKWIIRIVAVLFVLVMAVLVAVALSLDSIVKKGVETIGPSATQTNVKLKSAGVSIFGCRVELMGFFLGNPTGYKTYSAITVDDVSVSVKPATVFSDKLVVNSIIVKSPVITLEGGLSDNNLTKIEKNLNDYVGGSSTTPKSSAPASGPAKPERKFQVNELVLTGSKLEVNTKLSGGRTITLSIPDIHLTDLGTGPEGITGAQVGQQALHAVLNAATKAIAQNAASFGTQGVEKAKGAVQKAADAVKGLFH
jgi:uncharacterized protein involved in outer membrane biogenesis